MITFKKLYWMYENIIWHDIWMWLRLNNFSTGFYITAIFDKNRVIKLCRKINGSLDNVLFDLTYHILLKQYDYNVKILNNFNTHVLYEIVITSRITFLDCLSLSLIIFSFLYFNVIITTASSPNLRFNLCTKSFKKDSTSCEILEILLRR